MRAYARGGRRGLPVLLVRRRDGDRVGGDTGRGTRGVRKRIAGLAASGALSPHLRSLTVPCPTSKSRVPLPVSRFPHSRPCPSTSPSSTPSARARAGVLRHPARRHRDAGVHGRGHAGDRSRRSIPRTSSRWAHR
jgi:hypothetical protein